MQNADIAHREKEIELQAREAEVAEKDSRILKPSTDAFGCGLKSGDRPHPNASALLRGRLGFGQFCFCVYL